ncbi:hypothetical protein G9A89_002724 [Geosiphon pyriformis]|nr:hypothetical protein G9A89_002724 [Geosiphon pyriformis]
MAFLNNVNSLSAGLLASDGTVSLNILNSDNFVSIRDCLFRVGSSNIFVYTDGSLKNLGTTGYRTGAATFFKNINLGLDVGVSDLMSSTLAELQTIALALKCVPAFSSVQLFSNSQSVLDACKSELMTTTSKVVTQTDSRTLEYYQSIYTHCKQRFNISDGIETFKKTLYQYIENHINNYFFGNYNISEYCEKNYPVEQKFSIGFELETEEGKEKRKQKLRTTSNTPKTTAKRLQTPEQETSFKLPLSITPFPSPKSPIQQQEPILTSTNLLDYLQENEVKRLNQNKKQKTQKTKKKWPPHISQKFLSSQEKTAKPVLKNGLTKSQKQEIQMVETLPESFKTAFLEQFTDNNTSITL